MKLVLPIQNQQSTGRHPVIVISVPKKEVKKHQLEAPRHYFLTFKEIEGKYQHKTVLELQAKKIGKNLVHFFHYPNRKFNKTRLKPGDYYLIYISKLKKVEDFNGGFYDHNKYQKRR